MPTDDEGALEPGYGELLWTPDQTVIDQAKVTAYQRWLAAERGVGTKDYDELWRWSTEDPAAFWSSIWDYFGVLGDRGAGPVLGGSSMPDVQWFEGATLNYARNALRTARTDPGRIAIIFNDENSPGGSLSYGELAAEVARIASGLRAAGLGPGDRVAALLPNGPHAIIGLLAAASLGAIWSSCSPDFGAASVIDRFAQIEPSVLIAVTGYHYNGQEHRRDDVVRQIAAALPGLSAVVLTAPLQTADGADDFSGVPVFDWDHFGAAEAGAAPQSEPRSEPEYTDVPFGHPLWVLYSSGTTGLPKPIVHGHGGIVLEHLKALALHLDLGADDVFFWYTTTGWMMWNFLAGGLLVGATVVAYDGSATYPGTDALWRLTQTHRVSYFGVGAPYLLACAKAGVAPGRELDLSALRGVGSTGSPLPPEGFRWVYEHVRDDVILGSLSGGTDLCTGFVGPVPVRPVRSGTITARCLGAAVQALDPAGQPVIGEVGELVISQPMPSMPVGFWNDPDGTRYRESYYADFPGRWRHGDWIKILPDGACIIYGRSDATLNRGGVRMGTSEFYRVVEAFPEVADSLVVDTGQLGADGRLILYVTLAAGADLDADLTRRLRRALRDQLSPRHVPNAIHQVPGIPRTLSGKKLEVPVRKILLGTPLAQAVDLDALANPDVLAYFAPSGDAQA
jgi:acetoacetyl-CoA synthetase